ncbi:MAG: Hsp20/alpha crystallin family protein, partial [Anaerolineaceae bacterium]|nr:Hsp20/alpha crystallin family protein [Anaerolineaceae bacterium]
PYFVNAEEEYVAFPVDIKVNADGYTLTAILPGLDPENIDVQIKNKQVILKGKFNNPIDKGSVYYHLRERSNGKIKRTFKLSDVIDTSKVKAKIENGILSLILPKVEEAKPKIIKVTAQ